MQKQLKLPLSPLLNDNPFPEFRKGKTKGWANQSSLLGYIKAVNPGLPPVEWRDVTPYWGGEWPRRVSDYRRYLKQHGYLIEKQTVRQNGLTYRRIAVALDPSFSSSERRAAKGNNHV